MPCDCFFPHPSGISDSLKFEQSIHLKFFTRKFEKQKGYERPGTQILPLTVQKYTHKTA